MAQIQRTIETRKTKEEMRLVLDEKLATSKHLGKVLKMWWHNDALYVESKLGSGSIQVRDFAVELDIELTLFGAVARTRIEQILTDEIKQISAPESKSETETKV